MTTIHDQIQQRKQNEWGGNGCSLPLGHVNGAVIRVTLQKLPGRQVVQAGGATRTKNDQLVRGKFGRKTKRKEIKIFKDVKAEKEIDCR
jgi:hypothetical protein